MQIKFKLLNKRAQLPKYQTVGAAAFDFHNDYIDAVQIHPGHKLLFFTGVSVEVPEGHALMLYSRSGHGFKDGLRLANCVGVIDSDYRGEIMAAIHNDSDRIRVIEPGSRIIQGMLVKAEQHELVEVSELSTTERGEKGFGSTGVK